MTEEEFLIKRKPFYIDSDSLLVKFASSKHQNCIIAEWFTDYNIPWYNMLRGYFMESDDGDFLMIYQNNYNIPNITCNVIIYLFHHFPTVKWIGLGCNIGKEGEIWEPQLRAFRQ